MKRTGSIGSRVGPAVITTFRPASERWGGARALVMASTISTGSAIRPGPNSPHAISPSPGPTKRIPRDFSVATLASVAGCRHIRTFMAGATRTGLSVASKAVEARSSARPCAILAMRSAVAGATTRRSAARDSWMWPISISSVRLNRAVCTFSPERLASERGVTNSSAARVRMVRTRQPRVRSRRISSWHL